MHIAMLSVCAIIITKNELDSLKRCISSISGKVDEIIVLDTGSTDGTVEFVGSKDIKIIRREWENDFSKARNIALEYADTDWVIFIDSDEEMLSSKEEISNALNSADLNDEVLCPRIYLGNDKYLTSNGRIIKRGRQIRYVGRVHEYIPDVIPSKSEILIRHHGYREDNREEKEKRNLPLLRKEIIYDRKNPRWLYFYANNYTLIPISTRIKVLEYLIVLLDGDIEKYENYYLGSLSSILRLSFVSKDFQLLFKYIDIAKLRCPNFVDFVFYDSLVKIISRSIQYSNDIDLLIKDIDSKQGEIFVSDVSHKGVNSLLELKAFALLKSGKYEDAALIGNRIGKSESLFTVELKKIRDGFDGIYN
ncbi:glycosyltransferase family 2 protein [Vibrio alginolyticus]|uniref:glycosyltransferase family 2 protein n=1 Tax=Vibrio alginolyticus TaxID=663 RepID=UPI00354EEDA2